MTWDEEQLRVAKEYREKKKPEKFVSLENLTLKIDANTLIQVNIKLPSQFITGLDLLVNEKLYASRAEAVREAIRDLLREKHPRTWDMLWEIERIE